MVVNFNVKEFSLRLIEKVEGKREELVFDISNSQLNSSQ